MIGHQWYGNTDYRESLSMMSQCADRALMTKAGFVMGFEYPTTITMGLRASRNEEMPSHLGDIPVVPVTRGGLVTLHNPGQVVIYPVVPIKHWGIFAKKWVQILSDTTEKIIANCNIIVVDKNAGIFTRTGKIASIGIDLKRGVSTHGIAVNISNNLKDFSKITPCGISQAVFDRVADHCDITVEDFFSHWVREFERAMAPYCEQSLTKSLSAP